MHHEMRHFFDRAMRHMARGHGGRHGFGRGFGRHGFEDGGRGHGRDGFRAGRLLRSGDLQLLILALLADKPRHGYEIIKAVEEHSQGFYAPSPGVIYPALTYLEEVGFAAVEVEGTRKLYRITAEGEAHLAANRADADAMLAMLARMGDRAARARDFLAEGEAEAEAGPTLRSARHALKAAVMERIGGGPEEERRIAGILERAAREIRGA